MKALSESKHERKATSTFDCRIDLISHHCTTFHHQKTFTRKSFVDQQPNWDRFVFSRLSFSWTRCKESLSDQSAGNSASKNKNSREKLSQLSYQIFFLIKLTFKSKLFHFFHCTIFCFHYKRESFSSSFQHRTKQILGLRCLFETNKSSPRTDLRFLFSSSWFYIPN